MILLTRSPFLRKKSDFSKHTGGDYYKCCQGELKLWVETFVLEFTNEIPDDNEDSTEDDVRNIRGDIVIEPFSDFIGLSGMILMM